MVSLGRRLKTLEACISPDRPKLIFIMPYVDPSELVSGIATTVGGKTYSYAGDNLDAMLGKAEAEISAANTGLICELVSVEVSLVSAVLQT